MTTEVLSQLREKAKKECALSSLKIAEWLNCKSDLAGVGAAAAKSRHDAFSEVLRWIDETEASPEYARMVKMRDHLKKTWSPPLKGPGHYVDAAQTAIMQAMAYVMGKEFLGELTPEQQAAIDQGYEIYRKVLGE